MEDIMEASVKPIGHSQRDKGTTQAVGSNGDLLEKVRNRLQVVKGPDHRGEYVAWCVFHQDGNGKAPHTPNLYVSERGFVCHACGEKGSLRDLARRLGIGAPTEQDEIVYDYRDESGALLFQKVRYPGKRFLQRRPDGNGGWIWNLKGVRQVLYRLPEVVGSPDVLVFVVEGEKDVDTLARHGLLATTNPGGAGKWQAAFSKALSGRDVVILPDNDDPGRRHAEQVATSLHGLAQSVRVVALPGLPAKGDVSDWLGAGHTVEELDRLADAAPEVLCGKSGDSKVVGAEPKERQSQADKTVGLLEREDVTLFHDDLGDAYARVPVGNHFEVYACNGRSLKRWLAHRLRKSEGTVPGAEALNSALNVIEAMAWEDGDEYKLCNRVAQRDGEIWYDLADAEWRAIKVTADGWGIVSEPPILFRRHAQQQPQVDPATAASDLADLFRFINIADRSQRLLLLVYVVSCLVLDMPHPVLVLSGPQGSAKTTALRMLRRLIDPSAIEVLTLTEDDRELVQQLSHNWAPYFDNVSSLPGKISDTLCRAVTGDGFSKRRLYCDDDDVIYRFHRCVGMSGINVTPCKPDLLDRCIVVGLEAIGEQDRKTEQELWSAYEQMRPRLVGGMFSVLARAMALLPSIKRPALPRMADFAHWGCAIAEAMGYSQAEFLSAYRENDELRNVEVMESSQVARAVIAFMDGRDYWEGEPSELLAKLEALAHELGINLEAREWPRAANVLTRRLNVLSANLLAAGVKLSTGTEKKRRRICLRRVVGGSLEVGDGRDGIKVEPSPIPSPRDTSVYAGNDDGDDRDGIFPTLGGRDRREIGEQGRRPEYRSSGNTVVTVSTVSHTLAACESMSCESQPCDGTSVHTVSDPKIPSPTTPGLPQRLSDWPPAYRDQYEERAAIMEFDGGVSREDADKWAETILREIFAKAATTRQGGDGVCGHD